MPQVLWKELTETDYHAMHGQAAPGGTGGGARHIALGAPRTDFQVDKFLGEPTKANISITAAAPSGELAELDFNSNQGRRGGEWIIRAQATHRHPAWNHDAGFPATYDPANPPFILIFRVGDGFHARFASRARLRQLDKSLALLFRPSGVVEAAPFLLSAFNVPVEILTEALERQARSDPAELDPSSIEDARKKVFAAIIRRQGQPAFRRLLFKAYGGRCAVSGCSTRWVLEAAHIVPYRGTHTNRPTNGLLLRADIHTLFDIGLIAVRPEDRLIAVSRSLRDSEYWLFNGRPMRQPADNKYMPNKDALVEHFKNFSS